VVYDGNANYSSSEVAPRPPLQGLPTLSLDNIARVPTLRERCELQTRKRNRTMEGSCKDKKSGCKAGRSSSKPEPKPKPKSRLNLGRSEPGVAAPKLLLASQVYEALS
jgi:hypothetical protein